jgi:hypothetical protein
MARPNVAKKFRAGEILFRQGEVAAPPIPKRAFGRHHEMLM